MDLTVLLNSHKTVIKINHNVYDKTHQNFKRIKVNNDYLQLLCHKQIIAEWKKESTAKLELEISRIFEPKCDLCEPIANTPSVQVQVKEGIQNLRKIKTLVVVCHVGTAHLYWQGSEDTFKINSVANKSEKRVSES